MALQILCGFSVEEIANALLSKTETIKKRLQRARETLRTNKFHLKTLSRQDIQLRLDLVLTKLYLLFNEGYFSNTGNFLVRKDLCLEAIRLALILTDHGLTNTPQSNALLALMCFQSSRLAARTTNEGVAILFDEQDQSLWDKTLIGKGNYYLIQACDKDANEISKYHLEAAIAYWHTTPTDQDKWQHILNLYNQLVIIEYSPIIALNRAFAFSKVYGYKKAIVETRKLNLVGNEYYNGLLGYLYADANIDKAIGYYEQATRLTKSKTEKQTLVRQIKLLRLKKGRKITQKIGYHDKT